MNQIRGSHVLPAYYKGPIPVELPLHQMTYGSGSRDEGYYIVDQMTEIQEQISVLVKPGTSPDERPVLAAQIISLIDHVKGQIDPAYATSFLLPTWIPLLDQQEAS